MNSAFLLSVILKGIGALLEVLLQVFITGAIGVEGYGTYAAWINGADLIFWIGLSGLVKCNTFYLSGKNTSLKRFKKKYYFCYALPLLIILAVVLGIVNGTPAIVLIPIITSLELLVLDNSSSLLARGRFKVSLFGEYALGRIILVLGVLLLQIQGYLQLYSLLGLYIFQYLVVLAVFVINRRSGEAYADISQTVSVKKWGAFQQSDLMHSMIEQMPVVAQYLFSGAFEAGVVSIVLLVKKLINFISGPTAKVFLPEFSRLYHAGDKDGIRNCYHAIMRIQMIVVGPLSVVLIGYPGIVLGILAEELVEYQRLFTICSVIFLLTASLGPCGGILQMTGNERKDNLCREIALGIMVAVMLLTRKDPYFVLYGLCAQIVSEAILKYSYVCRWMERPPVRAGTYGSWWLPPGAMLLVSRIAGWQSFFWMVFGAGVVFLWNLGREWKHGSFSRGRSGKEMCMGK